MNPVTGNPVTNDTVVQEVMHVNDPGRDTFGSAADLLDVDLNGMSDAELADHVVALERHRARLDGALADTLARFDARRTYEGDGAVTAKAWLKHHCHMTGPQAGTRLAVARRLQRLPVIAAALRAGEITFDQVRLMLRRCTPATQQALTDDQQTLVDVARSVHIDDLPRVLDVWAAFTDPDGTEPDHPTDTLHLDQDLDGRFQLRGDIDSTDGDLLGRALRAAERHLGSSADPEGRPIDPAGRRAHALADLARHYLGCTQTPTPARPTITILTNASDLALGLGARTERGTWITGDHVRRFLCDAVLQAALTDAEGNLIHRYGRGEFPDAALRRAIYTRDRTCQFNGCDRTGHQCEIHHLTHRAGGGETTPDNLALFCDRHHHLIHRKRWTAHREPSGTITIRNTHGEGVGPPSRWGQDTS